MRQVVRFMLGGGAGVAAYYVTLYCLTEFVGIWYVASSVIAWLLNWSLNFSIQKFWTFRNFDSATVRPQMAWYFVMALGFLVAGTWMLYLLVERAGLHYLAAQLIVTAVLSTVSFFLTRRIFRTEEGI